MIFSFYSRLPQSLRRFLIVGSATVGVDALVYSALLWVGLAVDLAKALGLIAATIFAYFFNKSWTFPGSHGGVLRFIGFVSLYSLAIVTNTGVNHVILVLTDYSKVGFLIAYFGATATSATLNYVGMRWFVFRSHAISAPSFKNLG